MDTVPKESPMHIVGLLAGLGLLILVLVLITPGMVEGRTIVVPDEFPTIQQAIDNASSGDTIRLMTGEFDAADELTSQALITVDKSISIVGNGTTQTTIIGGSTSAILILAPDVNLSALAVVGNGTDVGVFVNGTHGCRIEDVQISTCNIGILIEGSQRVIVRNSAFIECERSCLDLDRVENSTLDGLSFRDNDHSGIHFLLSSNNTVSDCTFYDIRYPLTLTGSPYNRFSRLDVKWCNRAITTRYNSHNTTVEDSTFFRAGEAIDIGANDTRVSNCTFERSHRAVQSYSSFVVIEDCTITNSNREGIRIITGGWIRVSNCTIHGSDDDGIYISDNSENLYPITIENCRITTSGENGIHLDYRGGVGIYGTHISSSERYAILGSHGNYITVVDNHITANRYGIYLWGGVGNIIGGNIVTGTEGNGLTLGSSSVYGNHWVHNNTFIGNGLGERPGTAIYIGGGYSKNTTIEHNLIEGNHNGIVFSSYNSGNNTVRWNTIKDSALYGISIKDGAGPNVFYFNLFLNNKIHVLAVHPEDVFDNGRYGNYWDDYQERYPNAQQTGAVWDTPYEVKRTYGVFDRYPLAYFYETNPPVAEAGPDMVASYGVPITFDGSRSTDDSAIATYVWRISLGEGAQIELLSLSPYMTFTFDWLGKLDVTFSVFDVWGSSNTDTMTLTVIDDTPPVANAGNDLWVEIGRRSSLDAGASRDNIGITSYWWTVDPGGLDIDLLGIRPTFSINRPGNYSVVLYVEDAAGNRGSDTLTLEVGDTTPPVADAGHDIIIDQGGLAFFDGTGSHDDLGILEWRWEFVIEGSSFVIMGATSQYYFLQAGSYVVTLTVEDQGMNTATDTMAVHVWDTEPPLAVPGNDSVVPQGTAATFNGSRSTDNVGVTNYVWAFLNAGNMLSINGQVIDFIFYDVGEYKVMLTVSDATGNQNSTAIQVTVLDSTNPSAVIVMASEVDAGTRVLMNGGPSTDNVSVEAYTWTFVHDGRFQRLQGAQVSFNFTMPGEYRIRLEVVDAAGNQGVDETVLIVHPDFVQDGGGGPWMWLIVIVLFIGIALTVLSFKYLHRDDLETEAKRKK